jgi:RNA polymerase sigma factor (sigma-70 family)
MARASGSTVQVQGWLDRLKEGDESARDELLRVSCDRLTQLARKMLLRFERVRRWEQTDDVLQNALMRLYRTLAEVQPKSPADFYRLAALNIRRELLDLAKHHFGPLGAAAKHASVAGANDSATQPNAAVPDAPDENPHQLATWTEFHEAIARLPEQERELFDFLWYQNLTQAEVANMLGV